MTPACMWTSRFTSVKTEMVIAKHWYFISLNISALIRKHFWSILLKVVPVVKSVPTGRRKQILGWYALVLYKIHDAIIHHKSSWITNHKAAWRNHRSTTIFYGGVLGVFPYMQSCTVTKHDGVCKGKVSLWSILTTTHCLTVLSLLANF